MPLMPSALDPRLGARHAQFEASLKIGSLCCYVRFRTTGATEHGKPLKSVRILQDSCTRTRACSVFRGRAWACRAVPVAVARGPRPLCRKLLHHRPQAARETDLKSLVYYIICVAHAASGSPCALERAAAHRQTPSRRQAVLASLRRLTNAKRRLHQICSADPFEALEESSGFQECLLRRPKPH